MRPHNEQHPYDVRDNVPATGRCSLSFRGARGPTGVAGRLVAYFAAATRLRLRTRRMPAPVAAKAPSSASEEGSGTAVT